MLVVVLGVAEDAVQAAFDFRRGRTVAEGLELLDGHGVPRVNLAVVVDGDDALTFDIDVEGTVLLHEGTPAGVEAARREEGTARDRTLEVGTELLEEVLDDGAHDDRHLAGVQLAREREGRADVGLGEGTRLTEARDAHTQLDGVEQTSRSGLVAVLVGVEFVENVADEVAESVLRGGFTRSELVLDDDNALGVDLEIREILVTHIETFKPRTTEEVSGRKSAPPCRPWRKHPRRYYAPLARSLLRKF